MIMNQVEELKSLHEFIHEYKGEDSHYQITSASNIAHLMVSEGLTMIKAVKKLKMMEENK